MIPIKKISHFFFTFDKIGAFTFGGGYAMISLLDHECVEKRQWITSDELMDVTVIAESTPGPIAINCATYTGYKMAGLPGAVASTLGIILPSFFLIFAVSRYFENILSVPAVANAFRGIRIAVAILIIRAAINMIRKMIKKSPRKKIQASMVAAFFFLVLALDFAGFSVSTIYLILASGLAGFFLFQGPAGQKAGGAAS